MKISQLIKELQAVKREWGDIECCTPNQEFGSNEVIRRASFSFDRIWNRGEQTDDKVECVIISTE